MFVPFRITMAALTLTAAPVAHGQPVDPSLDRSEDSEAVCRADAPPLQCGPGFWIGPLEICSWGPINPRLSHDEYSGMPVLVIQLDEGLQYALAAVTAERIGQHLPFRLDGRTLTNPVVSEEIMSGELQISGPDMEELAQLQAALQGCGAAAG